MNDPIANLPASRNTAQLGSVLAVLRKRKWLILALCLCAGGATAFFVSKQPKIYRATASIVIELSVPQYLGSGFRDVVEVEPSWWHSRETLGTEFRSLRSHSQSVAMARVLCDRQLRGASALRVLVPKPDCEDPQTFSAAAPALRGMLEVSPVADSRIVELIATSHDPEFATMVANTAAHVYAERSLERRLSYSTDAATWLGEEYTTLMEEQRSAEIALTDFKQKNNVITASLEDDQGEVAARRRKLAEELSTVEVTLIAMRADKEQLDGLGGNDPLVEANPILARNAVAQHLKELYIEEYGKLIALQSTYGDRHPAIVSARDRLTQIKQDLAREVKIGRRNFDVQYEALTKQAADLRAALNKATRDSMRIEGKAAEYNRLKRELDRLIKLTDQLGGRERETALASNLKTNNVRILDAALLPKAPVSPNVPRSVALAVAVALIFSIGLAFALDALDSTVKTQEDVEYGAGMTFLGLIPTIDPDERTANGSKVAAESKNAPLDLYVYWNPKSQVAECCRSIRTNLLFMQPDKPARSMLITSAGPQEGKTTVAVSLGITMATSGLKVLLVDTDMRRPRLHKALDLARANEGVSSAILGKAAAMSYVRETAVPNLWALPCGACPPNPAELLHAERFRTIVAELAAHFDRVIFDSPPLGAVTDASILARSTDATLMVAKAGRTSKHALGRVRRQISLDGSVNLLGCVLNDVNLSKQREYGYYSYYYSRYGYYAQNEEQPAGGSTAG